MSLKEPRRPISVAWRVAPALMMTAAFTAPAHAQAVSLGEPDPIYRRLSDAACQAYEAAIRTIKAGVTTRQLAVAMNAPVKEAGFTWYRPQWQGLGLEQVEGPMDDFYRGIVVEGGDIVLEENMVLGLQPMAGTADRTKGIQVGDAIVVTKDGVRKLGQTRMEMHIV